MTSAPFPVEPDHKTLENLRASIMDLVGQYSDLAHATKPFIGGTSPVPVSGRVFDSSDVKSLMDSALDFWLTAGRFNDQFRCAEYQPHRITNLIVVDQHDLIHELPIER